ncbi:MAG: heavy-metal-associated domain-containing protein [Verrucomicrobiota bacterium]|nr:heavy-metal-associated domain-containing protein [Verrucomicrobiota bacterium]
MSDPANEAGLHEHVDAEFSVEGLESPGREKALRDALGKLSGLESLSISRGKVMAHYEPVLLSRKQLEEAIQQAGFQISETHSAASSPLTDAFAEENNPPENT